jgi:hypothetical protein
VDRNLLSTYLNDHLAGATAALDLAGRSRDSNRGTEFGPFLEELRGGIEYDRRALEGLMARLDIGKDELKHHLAWVTEKVGRLKPNGFFSSYSPLSRLEELEALTAGVKGKLSLWQALQTVSENPELSWFDYGRFIERARSQLDGLEQRRLLAARLAFGENGAYEQAPEARAADRA